MAKKKVLKIAFMSLGFIVLVFVVMLVSLSMWLLTDEARQVLFHTGIGLLEDKLQTKVKADSISVELLKGQVRLYGMQVNDRDDSLLLGIKELHAGIAVHELLDHKVRITDVELQDAKARLWKDSLTSNFQFVIDAFKSKKPKKDHDTKAPKMELLVDVNKVKLQNIRVKWDVRHKARKNLNKPMRGAFDANHVDVVLNMKAKVQQTGKNAYDVDINDMNVHDLSSGLNVEQLQTNAHISKESINVGGVLLKMKNSEVRMEKFTIDLKKKTIDTPFTLKANVLLQDIAQPFAPALSHFTTPLLLTTDVSGPLRCLNVENIDVRTPDKHLHLTAHGQLDGLFARKEGLNLQFRDIDMTASHNMKEQIVMHFAKKMRLKMIRQMKAVGNIRFQGSVDVLYKREIIAGKLTTRYGYVKTRFTIDGFRRYMTGYLTTPSLDMGKLMNIPHLGPIKCKIDFDFNISRKTPRPVTALPNGRLPMGTVRVKVYNANYNTLNIKEVDLQVKSDGSTASGTLWIPGRLKNMSARVNYVQTDKEQRVWFQFTRSAQQWLMEESVNLLSDKLQADVEADSINVHLFEGEAKLYGIRIKDRENNPMFKLDTLHVTLNAQELLAHKVHVTHLALYGLQTQLTKDSFGTNFGFVVGSFAKKKPRKPKTASGKKRLSLQLVVDLQEINIQGMRLKWDVTNKPPKNLDNPKKGTFDANHIDAELNLQAGLGQGADGGYKITLRRMSLAEHNSGLVIDDIHTNALWHKDLLHLDTMCVQMAQSWLKTEPLTLNIKKKALVKPFGLHAHIVLQDIAIPFAPVLQNFSTPLEFDAVVGGSINGLKVSDIVASTPDGKLNLNGQGMISGIAGGKNKLHLKFDDINMRSDNETLFQLVMHFAKTVRLRMIRQMKKVGDVEFAGNLEVLPKQVKVAGGLNTNYGDVRTDFTLDSNTHFMTGSVDVPDLDIGKFLNIKFLKKLNTHIDFEFNTSSKAPRPATALPDGRLPQGHLSAVISNVKYSILHAKRVEADINSDGSTATGTIMLPGYISDLIVNFNYVQTDDEQRLKVRPKSRFHKFWRKKRK